MKQYKIINELPTIFADCEGIKAALLIGSFARNQVTSKSDMDYSLWIDKNAFNPDKLLHLLESKLSSTIKIFKINLRHRIVVYFKDCPKLELVWYEQLLEINRNYLGSEIEDVKDSIAYRQKNLEIDIEQYLRDITKEKKKNLQQNSIANIVRELAEKFIYEFESASCMHKRSDSYQFYFFYNIALEVAIQLNYLSSGKIEHFYLPKKFANTLNEKTKTKEIHEQEQLFFRGLNGTLYLPEANKKKRDLLSFFYAAIDKLNIHNSTEIQDIKDFLEFVYSRDFIWNFRDVAMINTKIKPGKIFRSSALTRYQNEDFFADFIKQYKINKVVDLRDKDEYSLNPYTEKSLMLFEHLHLSIDPRQQSDEFIQKYHYGTSTQIAYRHFALGHRHIFKTVFEQIDPAKDIFLIHCHAGKDRTGSVIALFGLLIGESFENLKQDYFESEMDTEIENLNAFLEIIETDGGAEFFLQKCGLSQDRIDYWKKYLTNEN
jgi:protein tyrosine/serine phosphatase/predicted nucleotidyltransferase